MSAATIMGGAKPTPAAVPLLTDEQRSRMSTQRRMSTNVEDRRNMFDFEHMPARKSAKEYGRTLAEHTEDLALQIDLDRKAGQPRNMVMEADYLLSKLKELKQKEQRAAPLTTPNRKRTRE